MKQKSLANKVLNEIIKFKSDMLKSKTVKCVTKNALPDYKKSRLIFSETTLQIYLWQYIKVVNRFIPLYHIVLVQIKTIATYYVSWKKKPVNRNSSMRRTKQNSLYQIQEKIKVR